ncbi:MAG TPA: hypothetical protein VHO91_06170 [Rhodopila sp.]|nr:hypothetical protein [Rhodopila sp.]
MSAPQAERAFSIEEDGRLPRGIGFAVLLAVPFWLAAGFLIYRLF